MFRQYSYAMGIALIFLLITACGDNGVSISKNNHNNTDTTDVAFDIQESENDVEPDVVEEADTEQTDTEQSDDDTSTTSGLCEEVSCVDFSTCDEQTGQCACNEGYFADAADDGVVTACIDNCVLMRCGPNANGCEAGVCQCADGYEHTNLGCTLIPVGLCADRQEPCPDNAHCEPETGECTCDFGEANPAPNENVNQEQLVCKNFCEATRCIPNSTCNLDLQQCICDAGFIESAEGCVPNLCEDKQCQEYARCNESTGNCDCDFGEKSGLGEVNDPVVCKTPCDAMRCSPNSTCDPDLQQCVCDDGYTLVDGQGCVEE